MVNDAILEADIVLNHARKYAILPDISIKDHSIMQKDNIIKKRRALRNILSRGGKNQRK